MKFKFNKFIVYLSTVLTLCLSAAVLANKTSTNFYQCDTAKGVVFSQFPCAKNAKLKTISTYTPKKTRSTDLDIKNLNKIQYQQKIDIAETQIKASENKVRVLKRAQAKEQITEKQKLERMMSDLDKKALKKQVTQTLKDIDKKYKKLVKNEELNLKKLTKSLDKLQKKN
ncbi:hypothetical protein [Pseudoalteromonas denitrificans]|uniref:DUF4124 domain-containing protein n=1 Tax=Pseudoalteromonas denitrificans DSM 6059 TaxID=1123010 RepID=A0A1I1PVL7_9GAMM|nr:hypothetical protein [Pseudoalteromonas denitrificans]SFD13815.1 hypothetical protein SAMN02745724_03611 [Pseudoalteromonas denitrificans DSM 6059]